MSRSEELEVQLEASRRQTCRLIDERRGLELELQELRQELREREATICQLRARLHGHVPSRELSAA